MGEIMMGRCGYCGKEITKDMIEDEEVLLCDCYFE
jgi:hypothetical protein